MNPEIIFIILVCIFVAMNMGIPGFAVSFSPSYGSDVKSRFEASVLYLIFVLIGAVLIGPKVVQTLISKITSPIFLHKNTMIIILLSTGISIFLSNIFKIPQSTSFLTVAAFSGAGLFYKIFYYHTVIKIFLVAILFSLISFLSAYYLGKIFYPPRNSNLKLYEKLFLHQNKMKRFIVLTNCYSAFGIGTNNVANVVAPLMNIVSVNIVFCILFIGICFAAGGFIFGKGVINKLSKEIVPIGQPSAAIISLITSTLAIIASLLGFPTPYAQFTSFSFFGISCLKDGTIYTFKRPIVKNFLYVWIIMPVITVFISYILHFLFIRK